MHSYPVPARHVVVTRNGVIYNYYVIQVSSKDAVGTATNSIVIDRNFKGHDALLLPTVTVKNLEALRKIMGTATEEHVAATWSLFEGLV